MVGERKVEGKGGNFCGLMLNVSETGSQGASTYKANLFRLAILQKPVVRVVAKSHSDAHIDPIFKNLGISKGLRHENLTEFYAQTILEI